MNSNEIEYYYLTDFTNPIVASLNISLYSFLREIGESYQKTIKTIYSNSTGDNKVIENSSLKNIIRYLKK